MESKELLKQKRKLQIEISALLNTFHEENPGFEVFGIYVTNEKVAMAETGDTQAICTNVNCTVHLI